MKTFVFLGVFLSVACIQVNGQNPQSFFEDYKNFSDSALSSIENVNNIDILSVKTDALNRISWSYGVGMGGYRSIFNVLNNLNWLSREMTGPKSGMEKIDRRLDDFDSFFDQLNLQRDVDESELPSKINDLVDDFVNRYTETLVELLDNMFTQTKHLVEGADKPAEESNAMIDTFAENIEKCLAVPKTEYKEILQCHQKTRELVLPTLAHNSAILTAIRNDLIQLEGLKLDGKTSANQLYYDMRSDSYNLYEKIQKIRDQREAEKDNKSTKSIQ